MVRNLCCTVIIDSVLANSKTQTAFLFTVHAIFRHDYPLAVEPAITPRPLVQKKLWEILYLLICSFLPCLSWLLRSRVRKFQRNLSTCTTVNIYSNWLQEQFCDLSLYTLYRGADKSLSRPGRKKAIPTEVLPEGQMGETWEPASKTVNMWK